MIAESNADERSILRAVAKFLGFEVMEAVHRNQLIALCRQVTPDLIVLDLGLPKLRSSDAIDVLREEVALPNLPLVAISNRRGNRRLPRRSTVFLPKPLDLEQFFFLIDKFLPGRMTSMARYKYLSR